MAVAVEGTPATNFSNLSANTSVTVAATVTAGTALLVGVSLRSGNTSSGVTWNGTAMTLLDRITNTADVVSELWGLVNPAAGAFNVVVTHGGTTNGRCEVSVRSLTGTDTTAPFGTVVKATGTSTAASATVTATASDLICDHLSASGSSVGTETGTASQTQDTQHITAGGAATTTVMHGAQHATGGVSVGMAWTLNNSVAWATCAVPVLAPTSAKAHTLSALGVGV